LTISRFILAWLVVGGTVAGACAARPVSVAPPAAPERRVARESPFTRKSPALTAWGIPEFFEVGREVRLGAGSASTDTTGWPNTFLQRAAARNPRAYLSSGADEQRQVFIYPEPDARGGLRRFALVIPAPRIFSTNGVVTAYWGHSPLFVNFALEGARSFASFVTTTANGLPQLTTLRARLEPRGTNPQDLENVFELEGSGLAVLEHKGLVPGAPLSFLEYSVYDRDAIAEDAEPTPVDAALQPRTLSVALTPLRERDWRGRRSFEASGYRVILTDGAQGHSYFVAVPLALEPRWAFGEASADLRLGLTNPSPQTDGGAGSAAALLIPHATRGALLSGVVRDANEVPALLERGARFLTELEAARHELAAGNTESYAAYAARAYVAAHRSRREPRALTQFAYGDAPPPTNAAAFSGAIRYGKDAASALRGLSGAYRAHRDPELRRAVAAIAESSLEALTPSGATLSKRFDEMAIVADHDDTDGRSDVFIDNGGAAVSFNHRRLVLSSGQSRSPGTTWGAFGLTVDGETRSVDEPRYAFSIDAGSLPQTLSPDQPKLGVSRFFVPDAGAVTIRETAELRRGVPAVSVRYRLENHGERSASVSEARITLADFMEYGTGANERSQNRYGLSRVVDGVRLPTAFWMEGMATPSWGDNFASGEVDLTEAYHRLGARFLVVYGFEKAQVYYLTQPADQLILHNVRRDTGANYDGFTRLEVRYHVQATLAPEASYDLPEVLSYTLRAPLHSADGDAVPDQLQELAPRWTRAVTGSLRPGNESAEAHPDMALETDAAQAALVYAWGLAADTLSERGGAGPESGADDSSSLVTQLRGAAVRGASFALSALSELRNRSDVSNTYANGNDYGFHLAIFDWAYRETCDVRYRDALLSMADELARSEQRGGLQIGDPHHPSYGGFIATTPARANGVSSMSDQGVRLWALRIAYERTGAKRYLRAAESLMNHWLRVRPEDHLFTGTVFAGERFRDAGVAEERTPTGHYAVMAGLKAWSDLSPRARALYAAGLEHATLRHGVHAIGLSGPYRMIFPREGIADFGADAELGGSFLWAMTLEPSSLRGRFPGRCRGATREPGAGAGAR
jgi:hypothetical protein